MKMLKLGVDLQIIIKATNLSPDKIKEFENRLKDNHIKEQVE
jgi:hypothetical protein